jgi:hypothetical protein
MLVYLIAGLIVLTFVIFYFKREKFTNQAGYYTDTTQCSNLTLRNCLDTANCGYCMQDGFNSQCVAGTKDGPTNGHCSKWYHNDAWTRAVLANDNDYDKYKELPIFD